MKIGLKPLTLAGATTRAWLLTPPLRARFGDTCRLDFYSPEELETIVMRSARIMDVPVDPEAALEIAARSRGTARVANRLLRRVRDYAQVKGDGCVTHEMACKGLDMLGVDGLGLDAMDKAILTPVIPKFSGGPFGLGPPPVPRRGWSRRA